MNALSSIMGDKFKILSCGLLFCLLSCATTSNTVKSAPEKSRAELEKTTHKIFPPEIPKERLYSVDGNARYKRMHEYDWKEAREGKEH